MSLFWGYDVTSQPTIPLSSHRPLSPAQLRAFLFFLFPPFAAVAVCAWPAVFADLLFARASFFKGGVRGARVVEDCAIHDRDA